MPEEMAKGASVQAALLVLGDRSISYLMRSENYRTVEAALSAGETLPANHVKLLLQIVAHDLEQDTKYAASILKLLTVVLKKLKLGEYDAQPELLTTATCIMNILSKTAPLHKVQSLQLLCLEVLLAFPEQLHAALGAGHAADLLCLVDQYLSNPNVESEIKTLIMDTLLKVLQVLPEGQRNKFVKEGLSVWFSRVVPLIFTSAQLREKAVTATELLIPDLLSVDYSDNPHWSTLFKNISAVDKYPAELKAMLLSGDQFWHRAWCCIVQLLGIKLHKSANLINSLLAVLENAFKMNVTDRCRAFHCWDYVIENFSLNMEQFTGRKIKLLLIPLLVNNAKEENSAYAKFKTWWLLMGKLQTKIEPYLDSIVMKFLNYCFGQPKAGSVDKPSLVPCLKFRKVQELAIQAMVEMVGHSECSGCVQQDFNRLSQPLLNANNLLTHFSQWLHAVKEATILISKLMNEQATQNVSCLWRSLFKYVNDVDDCSKQETVFQEFLKMLSELVWLSCENESLANLIFNIVMPVIFDHKSGLLQLVDKHRNSEVTSLAHVCKLVLCPSFKVFYSSPIDPSTKNRLKMVTDMITQHSSGFSKGFLQELSTDEHSLAWWMSLVNSIIDNQCHITEDTAKDICIWPITKLEYFTEVDMSAERWSEMHKYIAPKLPSDSQLNMEILNILMLHYKNLPVVNKFAVRILPLVIHSILENDSSKVVSMERELCILSELSDNMNELSTDKENALIDNVRCLSHVLRALSQLSDLTVAKYAVSAVNSILKHVLMAEKTEKCYVNNFLQELMISIEKFFSNKCYVMFAANLEESLSSCAKIDIPIINKALQKIIVTITSKGFRSERLSAVAANFKLINKNIKEIEEKCLDSKFSTPTHKLTPKNQKNNSKIIKKILEGDEEFVVVKSNWKFNPNKLTDHQKEVLKKKREDIPALYQDLSQSQEELKMKSWKMPGYKNDSQDLSTSVSNSLENDDSSNKLVSNILKDIPNPEICPNVMKGILTEDVQINGDQNLKINLELTKENSETKQKHPFAQKPKNTPLKSPRTSLKDRISRNVQHLLGKNNDNESLLISSDLASPMNKTMIAAPQCQTPEVDNKSVAVVFSAPTKLDSERPSRIKRKPKKLEGDFELPAFIKKRRTSLDFENKQSVTSMENQMASQSEEPAKECMLTSEKVDKTIVSDKDEMVDATTSACTLLPSEIEDKSTEKISTENNMEPEKSTLVDNICNDSTPKSVSKSRSKHSENNVTCKKKNRLEMQLAIDTVEGHPLLTPKDEIRSTRKSRTLNENSTPGKRNDIEKSKTRISLDSTSKIRPNSKKENGTENRITSNNDKPGTSLVTSLEKSLQVNTSLEVAADVPNSEDFIESSQESPLPPISMKSSRRSLNKKSARMKLNSKSSDSGSTSDSESDLGLTVKKHTLNENESEKETAIIQSDKQLVDINIKGPMAQDKLDKTNSTHNTNNSLCNEIIAEMDTQTLQSVRTGGSYIFQTKLTNETVTLEESSVANNNDIDNSEVTILNDQANAEIETEPVNSKDNHHKNIDKSVDNLRDDKVVDEASQLIITNIVNTNVITKVETKAFSDETIAEMDTEPFVCSASIPCSSDVIIIDDNSCDTNAPPVVKIDSDSELIAEADTEPMEIPSTFESDTCLKEAPIEPSLTKDEDPIQLTDIDFNRQYDENEKDPLQISLNQTICSPLKDNGERNNEFLNNTMDISPIKLSSPIARIPSPPGTEDNSNDCVIVSNVSPVKNNEDQDIPIEKCDSPEIFTNDNICLEKMDKSPPRNEATISTGSPSSSLSLKKNRSQVRQSGRGAQMLGLCTPRTFYSNTAAHPDKEVETEDSKRTPVITPAKRNLRVDYGTNTDGESNTVEVNTHVENFLSFTKALPSANSSPAGPILKRKFADIADDATLSPASKRKRVSFHDPPVSTTVSVQKYIEDSCIRSPQQSHNKKKDQKYKPLIGKTVVKKLENEYPESAQKKTTELSNNDYDAQGAEMEDTQINSLSETPQAEIVDRDVLNPSDPIYPELVGCNDSIANITEELTTDSMRELFFKDLANITTIGELAKLTELEINRLNIKTPKIETVRKVLANYCTKNVCVPKPVDTSSMDVAIQTEFEEEFLWNTLKNRSSVEVIKTCLEKKSDFIEQLTHSINLEAKQQITKDLPTSLIGDILCERINNDGEEADEIFTSLVQQHPQHFLNKTFQELGPESISEKLGLECIEEYLLKKLTAGELVKFCSGVLQKKIPCDK